MNIPENLYYSKTHEWIGFVGDKARIGMTDFAQNAMGDIVYVNLPSVGETIIAGNAICEVESVKAVSEVQAPISGTICAVNDALADAPESINSAPYEAFIVEIDNVSDREDLLSPGEYAAYCREEAQA